MVGKVYVSVCIYIYIYIYLFIYNSHHVMRIEKGTFENMAVDNFKSMRRLNIMLNVK